MKMRVTETYAGPAGVFAKDSLLDLSEADIKSLQAAGVKLAGAPDDARTFGVSFRSRNIRLQKDAPSPRTKPVVRSPKTK